MARAATKRPTRTKTNSTTAKTKNRRTSTPAGAPSLRTYRAALAYLDGKTNYEKMLRAGYNATNFNLSRMLRLLSRVGNPQKKLNCLHIAGTKGKGSTAHMLASVLRQAGFRTGLYTSPHFTDIRERVEIDGELISESEFTKVMAQVAAADAKMKSDSPTYFELLTALAFVHFAERSCEYVVLETGLGGRLDATNVVKPLVVGMTSISFDHMAQLGTTLEQIAEEKAGIFKPGITAISCPQPPAVRKVFKRVAEKVGCPVRFVGDDIEYSYRFEASRSTGPQTRVCLATSTTRIDHLKVPLLGEHQADNCGVALGMIDVLRESGIAISEQDTIDGLGKVQVQGRLEQIRAMPRTVVDAAHNAASVRALMKAIGQNIGYDSMVVIFGCSLDKDIDGMLTQLQTGADKIIFTSNGTPRSADPHELYQRFAEKSGKMAQVAPKLEDAFTIAQSCVTRDDLICITGSVYLVGEAKKRLTKEAFPD